MEPTQVSSETTPTVPSSWPGAFGAFKPSKIAVWFNLNTLLIIFGLYIVVGILSSLFDSKENAIARLVFNLLTLAVAIAGTVALLESVRAKKIDVAAAFKPVASKIYFNSLLLYIVAGFSLAISLLLLIVPFFFVLPRLAMAPLLLIDKNLGPIEAMKESWELSRGHSAKIWGVIGVTLLFSVLIVVLVGLYLLFIYQAAIVLLYAYLTQSRGAAPQQTVEEPAYPTVTPNTDGQS